MLLKQSLTQTCSCGQAMNFPEGQIRAKCPCGANWECGPEGYWYIKYITAPFVPILAKPVVCSVKSRAERYCNYPKSKKKGRKMGQKC